MSKELDPLQSYQLTIKLSWIISMPSQAKQVDYRSIKAFKTISSNWVTHLFLRIKSKNSSESFSTRPLFCSLIPTALSISRYAAHLLVYIFRYHSSLIFLLYEVIFFLIRKELSQKEGNIRLFRDSWNKTKNET